MILSGLCTDIDSRLGEIFMIPEKTFGGLSIMTVADLLQLPLIGGNLFFLSFLIRII